MYVAKLDAPEAERISTAFAKTEVAGSSPARGTSRVSLYIEMHALASHFQHGTCDLESEACKYHERRHPPDYPLVFRRHYIVDPRFLNIHGPCICTLTVQLLRWPEEDETCEPEDVKYQPRDCQPSRIHLAACVGQAAHGSAFATKGSFTGVVSAVVDHGKTFRNALDPSFWSAVPKRPAIVLDDFGLAHYIAVWTFNWPAVPVA